MATKTSPTPPSQKSDQKLYWLLNLVWLITFVSVCNNLRIFLIFDLSEGVRALRMHNTWISICSLISVALMISYLWKNRNANHDPRSRDLPKPLLVAAQFLTIVTVVGTSFFVGKFINRFTTLAQWAFA